MTANGQSSSLDEVASNDNGDRYFENDVACNGELNIQRGGYTTIIKNVQEIENSELIQLEKKEVQWNPDIVKILVSTPQFTKSGFFTISTVILLQYNNKMVSTEIFTISGFFTISTFTISGFLCI